MRRFTLGDLRNPKLLILFITLVAFGLRVWQLDAVPPGWRDDELIEALVISQKVLEGDWQFYYPDASGHEALYHVLAAGMLALFGPGAMGIRLLSAILGTLTVPLTYLLGRHLFGRQVGLLAAAALTISFWSLMYSRFGIRHINMPVLMMLAFYAFLRGLGDGDQGSGRPLLRATFQSPMFNFFLAGLFMGIGFYTYFAARGVPLILLAFCAYLWLFQRPLIQQHWRGLLLMFGVTLILALPLAVTLSRQPESEARVAEVGKPLTDALDGNFEMLRENTLRTLNMFHSDGDDEWLYNIPFRPLFSPIAAGAFWLGFLIALYYALIPLLPRFAVPYFDFAQHKPSPRSTAATFLLLWWLAGITPGFLSIPAGSLSHTITAQSAVYILVALPLLLIQAISQRVKEHLSRFTPSTTLRTRVHASLLSSILFSLLLLTTIAQRDLPDYFQTWPERGMVRFLYRADIQDVARYLNERPELTDFGVTSLLAGPWDKLALEVDLVDKTAVRPRWYVPDRVLLLQPALSFSGYPIPNRLYEAYLTPVSDSHVPGGYTIVMANNEFERIGEPVCFQNGLCSVTAVYDPVTGQLEIAWRVERPLALPPIPIISNPPPPGVYAGPRLHVFSHLLAENERFLAGDDGFWLDPTTLYPGDLFLQTHWLAVPEGESAAAVSFGLYDPMTGERILTDDGRDHLIIEIP